MVEQTLLSRFPATIPGIGEFFRSAERTSAVRTTASITFEYRPETQPINPRLLAESERLAVAEEESRRLAEIEVANRIRLAEENRAAADERQRVSSSGESQAGDASDPFGVVAAEDRALITEMFHVADRRIPPMPGGGAFGSGSGGLGGMGGFGMAAPAQQVKKSDNSVRADVRSYSENRSRVPAEDLARYAGRYVAWSPDGRQILADGADPDRVEEQLAAAGLDPGT